MTRKSYQKTRVQHIARVTARTKLVRQNPNEKRIIYLNQKIFSLRESINDRLEKVAATERQLMACIAERDALKKRRRIDGRRCV